MIKKKTENNDEKGEKTCAFTVKRSHCYTAKQIKLNKANENKKKIKQYCYVCYNEANCRLNELTRQMNKTQLKERISFFWCRKESKFQMKKKTNHLRKQIITNKYK